MLITVSHSQMVAGHSFLVQKAKQRMWEGKLLVMGTQNKGCHGNSQH